MTPIQTVIKFITENAFTIEGQDGAKYNAVVDVEELESKFDDWIELEKGVIERAYYSGDILQHLYTPEQYYNEEFNG